MKLDINKVDIIVKKIDYLFKSIKKNKEDNSTAEQMLLKKYATDLLDALLEAEMNIERIEPDLMKPPVLSDEINDTGLIAIQNLKQAQVEEPKAPIIVDFDEKLAAENPFAENTIEGKIEETFNPFKEEVTVEKEVIDEPLIRNTEEDQTEFEEKVEEKFENLGFTNDEIEQETQQYIDLPSKMSSQEVEAALEEALDEPLEEIEESFSTPTEKIISEGIQFIPNETPQIITDEDDIEDFEDDLDLDEYTSDEPLNLDDEELNVRTEVLGSLQHLIDNTEEETFDPEPKMELKDMLASDQKKEMNLAERFRQNLSPNKFNINDTQRYAFINELFAGDVDAYEKTLSDLSNKENVIDAFSYINLNVKMKYKWQDDSPTTRTFHEIVKNRYF